MILSLYDISGIQAYLFGTNRLKEILGASQLVHDALHGERRVRAAYGTPPQNAHGLFRRLQLDQVARRRLDVGRIRRALDAGLVDAALHHHLEGGARHDRLADDRLAPAQ